MKYRKSSHAVFDCRYHIVWITKYRRQVLNEELQNKLKIIIEWVCKEMYVNIIALWFEEDHVHLYVSIPPTHPIPSVVHRLKWRTSKVIWWNYAKYLKEFYWEKNVLWAVWYFVATVWEVNAEIIKNYVEEQWKQDVLWDEIEL